MYLIFIITFRQDNAISGMGIHALRGPTSACWTCGVKKCWSDVLHEFCAAAAILCPSCQRYHTHCARYDRCLMVIDE